MSNVTLPSWTRLGCVVAAVCALAPGVSAQPLGDTGWGTYLKPFAATSPWNARPVDPVLGDFEIPRSHYPPTLAEGKWSTGVFLARADDAPVTVRPLPGLAGVWDPDAEAWQSQVTLPRWPTGVLPAEGSDGHADIVDPLSGIVHSFYQLKRIGDGWHARQYGWTRLDGRGWGEPGHYFQGARAAAVTSMGGLIRKHEIDDGDSVYRHALAMSLTHTGMSPDPTYVFPATSADTTAAAKNSGRIPEGALLMLPPDYDTSAIAEPKLRKVAETLKRHGGYVVDRNGGTPFVIYVENGSNLRVHGARWNNAVALELDRMRAALRQVVGVSGWIDGNGRPMSMERRLNLLSMRGPWQAEGGGAAPGRYETWRQAVVFDAGGGAQRQLNRSGRNLGSVHWARPVPGQPFLLSAEASGGARLRLQLIGTGGRVLYDSGALQHGESRRFAWPDGQRGAIVTAQSGPGPEASSVGGSLRAEADADIEAGR